MAQPKSSLDLTVKDLWDPLEGEWDEWCSAEPDSEDRELVVIFDAEGSLICCAPQVGPNGQTGWPEKLAALLNAMTEDLHRAS